MDIEWPLALANKIMRDGTFGRCAVEIPKGQCTCCTFKPELGNWIGLLEGESQALRESGTTKDWLLEENRIECYRQQAASEKGIPFFCDNKPLDCRFYPFYPSAFSQAGEDFDVELIAGFPKCPLRVDHRLLSQYDDVDLIDENCDELVQHLKRVAICGLLLMRNGHESRMKENAQGFKGYERKYVVRVSQRAYDEFLDAEVNPAAVGA